SEDLFAKHLGEMQLAGIDQPDPEIAAAPDLARAIIARSSREGPQVYRLAWRFSAKTLHDGVSGHEYDPSKGDDPDAYVERSPEETLELPRLPTTVFLLVLPLLLPLLPQPPPLLVAHLPRRRPAHSHQALPGQRRRVRPLAARGGHRFRAHVLRQPEQLGQILRRHALELIQLCELPEPGQALQEVHPRRAGPAPHPAHHLLHGEEPV